MGQRLDGMPDFVTERDYKATVKFALKLMQVKVTPLLAEIDDAFRTEAQRMTYQDLELMVNDPKDLRKKQCCDEEYESKYLDFINWRCTMYPKLEAILSDDEEQT